MKGIGTTDAIFIVRQMQEKFRTKGKKLYFGFVNVEKAFDRVPREVIIWAMRKLRVDEWLVSAVTSMLLYTGANTVVRTVYGNSNGSLVKVSMHQGSALSRLLFVIVMEALSSKSALSSETFTKHVPLFRSTLTVLCCCNKTKYMIKATCTTHTTGSFI